MTAQDFVQYLESTLIPDLVTSGSIETATDFKMAAEFIKNPSAELDSNVIEYGLNQQFPDEEYES
jgi:hypothetical protein